MLTVDSVCELYVFTKVRATVCTCVSLLAWKTPSDWCCMHFYAGPVLQSCTCNKCVVFSRFSTHHCVSQPGCLEPSKMHLICPRDENEKVPRIRICLLSHVLCCFYVRETILYLWALSELAPFAFVHISFMLFSPTKHQSYERHAKVSSLLTWLKSVDDHSSANSSPKLARR